MKGMAGTNLENELRSPTCTNNKPLLEEREVYNVRSHQECYDKTPPFGKHGQYMNSHSTTQKLIDLAKTEQSVEQQSQSSEEPDPIQQNGSEEDDEDEEAVADDSANNEHAPGGQPTTQSGSFSMKSPLATAAHLDDLNVGQNMQVVGGNNQTNQQIIQLVSPSIGSITIINNDYSQMNLSKNYKIDRLIKKKKKSAI